MAQRTATTTTHYPIKFYSVEYAGSSTTTGTSMAREWTNIILWLAASVVFLFLSVTVFLPIIH